MKWLSNPISFFNKCQFGPNCVPLQSHCTPLNKPFQTQMKFLFSANISCTNINPLNTFIFLSVPCSSTHLTHTHISSYLSNCETVKLYHKYRLHTSASFPIRPRSLSIMPADPQMSHKTCMSWGGCTGTFTELSVDINTFLHSTYEPPSGTCDTTQCTVCVKVGAISSQEGYLFWQRGGN